jgi:hypothetical protein
MAPLAMTMVRRKTSDADICMLREVVLLTSDYRQMIIRTSFGIWSRLTEAIHHA